MKKALVTGAKGMLGQDLCPTLMDNGYDVIETDIDTLDITNPFMVREVLTRENPNIIIHCAGYTQVDKAEENKELAYKINTEGTKNLAKMARELDIEILYISTDYVFDGEKGIKYLKTDTPNPINHYGLTKYLAEKEVQTYCKKYYIVRTSWLYGIHGNNFVETMLSLKYKPEVKVVNDQIGCPTWTVDLSDGIVNILEKGEYGIYQLCGSNITSWYGFAKEIFQLAGLSVNLLPCKTDEFPRPAKRPKYSAMDNEEMLRPWQEALKDYMELRD